MYHPRVSGTYCEMGDHYGSVLHKHGFKLSKQPNEKQEFARRSERHVKRLFPEIIDEIQGFADATHTSYENMAAFLLGIGAFKVEGGCSEFAVFNGSDVVFGRNYDFYYRFKKYTEAYVTRPENGFSSLGHSDVFIGREDGINEKGLALAISFVAPTKVEPGINFALGCRFLLDKCASVDAAIEKLSMARFSTTNNYLLAQKTGEMAVVEAAPGRVRVRRPGSERRYLLATNHFVHPEMLGFENQSKRDKDSEKRYNAITRALDEERSKFDMRSAQKILSSHDGSVCSHRDDVELGTLWSLTASLKGRRVYRAEGQPCKTKYQLDKRFGRPPDRNQ